MLPFSLPPPLPLLLIMPSMIVVLSTSCESIFLKREIRGLGVDRIFLSERAL